MEQIAMAEQSKANTDSLSSEFSSVGGAVPTSPIGYIGNSRGRIAEVVRGAAPTSTPLDPRIALERIRDEARKRLPHGTDRMAQSTFGLIVVIAENALAASPASSQATSTPLDARQAGRREAIGWLMAQDYRPSPDEIEAWLLAASPASALVTKSLGAGCSCKSIVDSPASALVTGEGE
jgi:hypothetical protein